MDIVSALQERSLVHQRTDDFLSVPSCILKTEFIKLITIMCMQNKHTHLYLRVDLPENLKEWTSGTRQLNNIQSHILGFLSDSSIGLCTPVYQKDTDYSLRHFINSEQRAQELDCLLPQRSSIRQMGEESPQLKIHN